MPKDDTKIVDATIKEREHSEYNQPGRTIDDAIFDRNLPAFVRAFLVLHSLSATSVMIFAEAGYNPTLYAEFNGRPCRVNLVSNMGDIGIAFRLDRLNGYDIRGLSIYDLKDFSTDLVTTKTV